MKITKRKAKGVLADMIANMDEDSLAKTREKMEGISEDYCSQEVVKLLKEKGFDEVCWRVYQIDEKELLGTDGIPFVNHEVDEDLIAVPSLSLACKWLREVHGIMIITYVAHFDNLMEKNSNSYFSEMFNLADDLEQMGMTGYYDTYEEATEAAIKYCLENLI